VPIYRNPIQRAGDFADPFVLRHDGRYYLYCTNPDVRCWSSKDLIDWQLEGPTIAPDAFPGLVPFAPEVVYADGSFYMYTSPSGHGHFVLRSDSPTGPFRAVSGNVGHAIDGNVFIDDDGSWYFYWAGDEGIWGCEMPSPTEFGEPVFTGIHMNGWTEGPFVSKRDGLYLMTLTGNHYLSTGYRIDAAVSTDPLRGYRADPLNPIVIGADGPAVGLGHSSSVQGPDLVSTWMIYHNINPDASRDLDIDRQVWNGRSLQVLGPTTSAPAPAAPDLEGHGSIVSLVTAEVFTAEVNLTATEHGADYGLLLGDGLTLRVDRGAGTVSAVAKDAVIASGDLPRGFVHDALHCWRVVYDHGDLRLFLDNRLQLELRHELPTGSPGGTHGDLRLGYCALTHSTATEADRAAVKPVPGRFWASSEGFYELHVQQPGASTVYVAGEFAAGDELALVLDDGDPQEVRVEDACHQVSFAIDLDAASRGLTLRAAAGTPVADLITITPVADGQTARFADEARSGVGKKILGDARWDDVTATATLTFTLNTPDAHADLLIRASQLSEGGEGDDTRLGIDFFLGYSVQLHHDRVVVARHGYDERVLAQRALPLDQTRPHVLNVRAHGSSLAVDVDGVEAIRLDDALPHPAGHVGIRTVDSDLRVESLTITKE
jgi:hypothetical protein